jgi:hypothetical protein
VQDLWNSTPVWGFPYIETPFAPFPNANPILSSVGNTVLGGSAYAMIDNLVYTELAFYKGVSNKWLGNLGVPHGDPNIVGAAPYFRIAAQKQAGEHYVEVGFTGFWVEQVSFTPGSPLTNHYNDYALDASYALGASDTVSNHLPPGSTCASGCNTPATGASTAAAPTTTAPAARRATTTPCSCSPGWRSNGFRRSSRRTGGSAR